MYVHETSCITPQGSFIGRVNVYEELKDVVTSDNNIMLAREPQYANIPNAILRRMGRAVRLGVGAAMPLVSNGFVPDGIILGTSMGGMEDCIKFLNQIIEYKEGTLTPTNFVQSTANAVAGQVGLLSKNKGYNITHVHRGFSFENALIDASMMLTDNPESSYLLGSVDEISPSNHNIERLEGWYKAEPVSGSDLYSRVSPGSIAGEGSAMFIVSNKASGAIAKISHAHILQTRDVSLVESELQKFISERCAGKSPDLLLSGENGDQRLQHFYEMAESIVDNTTGIARFKHLVGEYPTSTGFACWLACALISQDQGPSHIYKRASANRPRSILLYNQYKGIQHSFMLIEAAS